MNEKIVEIYLVEKCTACNGSRTYKGKRCEACNGTGDDRELVSLFQALRYLNLPKEVTDLIYSLSS